VSLDAEASDSEPGVYTARSYPRVPGAYRATAVVKTPDEALDGEAAPGQTAP
jgi:hypothetical protein